MKTQVSQKQLDAQFEEQILSLLNETPEEDKKEVREEFQNAIINYVLGNAKIPENIKNNNKNLFQKYIKRAVITEGSEMKHRKKMFGRGLANNDNKYLKIGKYKANREKLLGGKLQIRSENENQVFSFNF